MLQVHYPAFDKAIGMVAPASSDIDYEPYRHTPSYHLPQSHPTTINDQSEPRTIPSQAANSRMPSSSSAVAAPATSNQTVTQVAIPSSSSQTSSLSSVSTPAVTSVAERSTPVQNSHVRHSSAIPPSATGTPAAPPVRQRRASSLQNTPPMSQPALTKLRDLAHLVELVNADNDAASQSSTRRRQRFSEARYDVSQMPVGDIIELVSALLTKITTTNDRNHENLNRNMPPTDNSGNLPEQATSVLAFNGKNVPTITINSYLSRIHRYCPTTYEVFLSLLVYFDRMTERVNAGTVNQVDNLRPATPGSATIPPENSELANNGAGHFFVVDSYNIHRLIIAGVTCASKFFSDIFYTNSRYAKVGGLPLVELNHLELQFLTLNDFRLSIPVEELESYGNMLVQFYAREEVPNLPSQQPAPAQE